MRRDVIAKHCCGVLLVVMCKRLLTGVLCPPNRCGGGRGVWPLRPYVCPATLGIDRHPDSCVPNTRLPQSHESRYARWDPPTTPTQPPPSPPQTSLLFLTLRRGVLMPVGVYSSTLWHMAQRGAVWFFMGHFYIWCEFWSHFYTWHFLYGTRKTKELIHETSLFNWHSARTLTYVTNRSLKF